MKCQRCHRLTGVRIMSMFNMQMICLECEKRERRHPDYAKAVEADREAAGKGDERFPGIGLPPELAPNVQGA